MNMVQILSITALIIAISLLLLCVRIVLVKKGTFSSQHIHDNKLLKKRGIHCVMVQDLESRTEKRRKVKE